MAAEREIQKENAARWLEGIAGTVVRKHGTLPLLLVCADPSGKVAIITVNGVEKKEIRDILEAAFEASLDPEGSEKVVDFEKAPE